MQGLDVISSLSSRLLRDCPGLLGEVEALVFGDHHRPLNLMARDRQVTPGICSRLLLPFEREEARDRRSSFEEFGQIDARSAFAAACKRSLTSASSRAAKSMRSC